MDEALFSGCMVEALTGTGPQVWREEPEFSFGLVDFEVSLGCPCGYKGLGLGIEPWSKDINLRILGAWMVIEAMGI